MNEIKVCYTERANIGDSINPYIFENVLKVPFVNSRYHSCTISGIGSGLRRFFVKPNSFTNFKMIVRGRSNLRPLILWSAGFISTPSGKEICTRNNLKVASVRGKLSKQWIETILDKKVDCSVGDGGLLVSELLETPIEKKYDIGIIPHDKDRDDPIVMKLNKDLQNSIVIDVRGDVMDTLHTIASCRTIISSSLHGLIISDSFHIPNSHIIISDRLSGDGFKFNDYYSSFDLIDSPIDLRNQYIINEIVPDRIKDRYKIEEVKVEKMKEDIKEAFFRFI